MKLKTKFAIFGTILAVVPVLLAMTMLNMQDQYLKLGDVSVKTGVDRVYAFVLMNYRQILALLAIGYIVVIIYVGVLFYKSMVSPLRALNIVALDIQDGNLEKKIFYDGNDEYKLVFEQFELMRIKLKDLLLEQIDTEKQRKLLFSNIAHDFKTPLTSIKGYAEGVLDGVAKDEETFKKYMGIIIDKADALSLMSEQLEESVMSEVISKRETIKTVEFKCLLSDIVKESNDMFNNVIITLENREEDEVYVKINKQSIARTVFNVIENSVKYRSSEKAIMKIETYKSKDRIIIRLADKGVGIEGGNTDKIFERFYRSDSARSSPEKGSGLGLSIAKELIEDMGGWIWARNKDDGLSIYISLPIVEEA